VQPLLVLGTHHFAPEVFDLVADLPGFRVDGFVENMDRGRTERPLEGLPVYWIDDVGEFSSTHQAVCALGTTRRSRIVEQAAAAGFDFATVVHPTAHVSRRSRIGAGSIVSAGAVVATHTHVGTHVILNRGALVGHDVEIGDFVTVGPGANIAGLCRIGARSYIGAGAVVIDRITVGEGAIVGAGAVVVKDVPPKAQVTGVPARVVKEDLEPR
jgi:sugar O-acyltransferase (sialic acid O-acetyltransferase NeuD family)